LRDRIRAEGPAAANEMVGNFVGEIVGHSLVIVGGFPTVVRGGVFRLSKMK
jgi:hypothetical protein